MTEVVGAVALLLAGISMLYGVWYVEIRRSMNLRKAPQVEDRRDEIEEMTAVLWRRAVPLLVASVAFTLIVLPEAIRIVVLSWQNWCDKGWAAARDYDAAQSALLGILLFAVGLGYVLLHDCKGLAARIREFER